MIRKLLVTTLSGLIFFTCSKTSDKDYMKMANEKIEKGNIPEAISDLSSLVEEHPESELAPEAILRQAALYHDNKVKDLSRREALIKSAELFTSVSEKYPKNEKAPSSLFMAGFIYANEVQDYNKAKEIYNLFIKKYPDNELAASAKEELNNLGLSPDEILKKKISLKD